MPREFSRETFPSNHPCNFHPIGGSRSLNTITRLFLVSSIDRRETCPRNYARYRGSPTSRCARIDHTICVCARRIIAAAMVSIITRRTPPRLRHCHVSSCVYLWAILPHLECTSVIWPFRWIKRTWYNNGPLCELTGREKCFQGQENLHRCWIWFVTWTQWSEIDAIRWVDILSTQIGRRKKNVLSFILKLTKLKQSKYYKLHGIQKIT